MISSSSFLLVLSLHFCTDGGAQMVGAAGWPGDSVAEMVALLKAVLPVQRLRSLGQFCAEEAEQRAQQLREARKHTLLLPAAHFWRTEADRERMQAAEDFFAHMYEQFGLDGYQQIQEVYVMPFVHCMEECRRLGEQFRYASAELRVLEREGKRPAVEVLAEADAVLDTLADNIERVQEVALERLQRLDSLYHQLTPAQRQAVDTLATFSLRAQMINQKRAGRGEHFVNIPL